MRYWLYLAMKALGMCFRIGRRGPRLVLMSHER